MDVIKLHSKSLDIREDEMQVKVCLNETTPKWYKSSHATATDTNAEEKTEDQSEEKEMRLKMNRYSMLGGQRYLPIAEVRFEEEFDFMVVQLKETLKRDTVYELYVPFAAELTDSLAGYYRSSYFDKGLKQKKWLAATQFEPHSARLAFPCFDEPEFKAIFEVSLAHSQHYSALSNMPVHWSEPMEGKSGWVWDHFEESVPMSTYLVAYAVHCFPAKDGLKVEGSDTQFKVWARPDAIEQTEYASVIGPKTLKFFEDYFEQPFPLPKTDMIAIPDFKSAAMENWGLITYRESALLFQPNVSSFWEKYFIGEVVAHELAHQWFGKNTQLLGIISVLLIICYCFLPPCRKSCNDEVVDGPVVE